MSEKEPEKLYDKIFVARQPILDASLNTWGYFHYFLNIFRRHKHMVGYLPEILAHALQCRLKIIFGMDQLILLKFTERSSLRNSP